MPLIFLLLFGFIHGAPRPSVETIHQEDTIPSNAVDLPPLTNHSLPNEFTLFIPTNESEESIRVTLHDPPLEVNSTIIPLEISPTDEKWWCGNNTITRGLAHAIAKHDASMHQINECCRVHDYEYDNAKNFDQVQVADTKFDECLASENGPYRTYIVRPLFSFAINMNYAYERLKSAIKTRILGGDGLIDLR